MWSRLGREDLGGVEGGERMIRIHGLKLFSKKITRFSHGKSILEYLTELCLPDKVNLYNVTIK